MRIMKRFLSLSAAISATPPSDLQNADHHTPRLLGQHQQQLHPNPPSSSDHTTQIGLEPTATDLNKTNKILKDELESERKQKEIIKTADTDCCRLDSAVLDLAADDSGGLQKQKASYHWDKETKHVPACVQKQTTMNLC